MEQSETSFGIGSGRGVLSAMLNWLRRDKVQTDALPPVEPPSFDDTRPFDPVAVQAYLDEYAHRYAHEMTEHGLILGAGATLPPLAFPELKSMLGSVEVAGQGSFDMADFKNAGAAIEWARKAFGETVNDFAFGADAALRGVTSQVVWLANVALLNAARRMAPFVYSMPRMEVDSKGARSIVFDGVNGVDEERIFLSASANPMALRKAIEDSLQHRWLQYVGKEVQSVTQDLLPTLISGGWPRELAASMAATCRGDIQASEAISSFRRAHFRFCSISNVSALVRETINGIDRAAVNAVMRHGTGRLTWKVLDAHADPLLIAAISAHRSEGALALAQYSAATLRKLHVAHLEDRDDVGYEGEFSRAFVTSLAARLSSKAVEMLQAVSPRYLAAAVFGHHQNMSLEAYLISTGKDVSVRKGHAAGRRLGEALNALVEQSSTRNPLPWASILYSPSLYDLLEADARDAVIVQAVTSLLQYANAKRSSGASRNEGRHLPDASEILEAPSSDPVGALLEMRGPRQTPAMASSLRMAGHLARELIEGEGAILTRNAAPGASALTTTAWSVDYFEFPGKYGHFGAEYSTFSLCLGSGEGGKRLHTKVELSLLKDDDGRSKGRHSQVQLSPQNEDGGGPVARVSLSQSLNGRRLVNWKEPRKGARPSLDRQSFMALPHAQVRTPAVKSLKGSQDPALTSEDAAHQDAMVDLVFERFWRSLLSRPFHMAALLPAVAREMKSQGAIAHLPAAQVLSSSQALRLTKVCLHSAALDALELIASRSKNPCATTAAGHTMLDIALESDDEAVPAATLRGLRGHPQLQQDPSKLAEMVQASVGKLVERHPGMLPLAIELGAGVDEDVMRAWHSLHPRRQSPESQAALNEALMRATIARARADAPVPEREMAAAGECQGSVRRRRGAL